jgi:hypothetical protein
MTWRQELAEMLPWVTLYKRSRPCDGYRWGQMSLKAVHDPELKERYRCKNQATWRFKTSRRKVRQVSGAHDGVYCWSHLCVQLNTMDEFERSNKYWSAHLDEVNAIRVRGGVNPITKGS